MSIEHYWAACRLDIPATQKSLLRLISLSYNAEHDRACYFSLETLAAYTSLNKSTVIRATDWLEEIGLLAVARGGGRHAVNLYVPIPYPNDRVSAIKERVAPRDRFSASALKEAVASRSETVALGETTVAECCETVAPRNPKGFKEEKEKEKLCEESTTEQKPEFYELPEYRASFSEKDAALAVMYHRHGKEKLAKFYSIEDVERIAALIAEVQEQEQFGVEKNGGAPTLAATETTPPPVAADEAKAKADHIAKAKAACPVFTHDSNVIHLNIAPRRPGHVPHEKPGEFEASATAFRELLAVGGISPETADKRLGTVVAMHWKAAAAQFMREFIATHGEKIRTERKPTRTSGAIAASVRWFKSAQLVA